MTGSGRSPVRCRDDRGTALIEFVWLGLLLLIPLVYIMISLFQVQSAAYGANAASRAAGRAYVLAADERTAIADAETAARTALADQGIDTGSAVIEVVCSPDPDRCLRPGSTVTVVVTVDRKLPLAPTVLGGAAPQVTVDATHVEPYGTFREERS